MFDEVVSSQDGPSLIALENYISKKREKEMIKNKRKMQNSYTAPRIYVHHHMEII